MYHQRGKSHSGKTGSPGPVTCTDERRVMQRMPVDVHGSDSLLLQDALSSCLRERYTASYVRDDSKHRCIGVSNQSRRLDEKLLSVLYSVQLGLTVECRHGEGCQAATLSHSLDHEPTAAVFVLSEQLQPALFCCHEQQARQAFPVLQSDFGNGRFDA